MLVYCFGKLNESQRKGEINMIKKIMVFCMAAVMVLGMGTTAFAAENNQGTRNNPFSDVMSELSDPVVGETTIAEGVQPKWWPGDGPAPQVTRMEITDIGTLNSNGNLCIVVKVYGYGSDYTTFDGNRVKSIANEPFIISGTGADGFY